MSDEQFIEKYEELLNKGYCDCNEMNCLDNDVPTKILNIVKGTKLEAKQLLEENQELKKQLENCYCNRIDCVGRIKDSKLYDSLVQKIENQQKEFIEWLEAKIKNYELPLTDENKKALGYTLPMKGIYKEILEKYKEIVGGNNDQ